MTGQCVIMLLLTLSPALVLHAGLLDLSNAWLQLQLHTVEHRLAGIAVSSASK